MESTTLRFGDGAVKALGFTANDGPGVAFCAAVEAGRASGKSGRDLIIDAHKSCPGGHAAYLEACADANRWAIARRRCGRHATMLGARVQDIATATGADLFACLSAIEAREPALFRDAMREIRAWRSE